MPGGNFARQAVFLIAILSCNLPLNAAAEQSALMRVGRAKTPPKIDGVLDDACWQQAVELAPFFLKGKEPISAREQTRAYLAYDAENLYVAFHCEASALDPVNNRVGDFQSKVKENDSTAIFKDDCVVVLLDTNADHDTFFDLFINAAGAVSDARCGGENPWKSRDLKWNSNSRIGVSTGKGFYIVEAAIPLSALGVKPRPGEKWGICLGRVNRVPREVSVWSPMKIGFHNAGEFGTVVFGESLPGLRNLRSGEFIFGKNTLVCKVVPVAGEMNLRLETTVRFRGQPRVVTFKDFRFAEPQRLEHVYALDRKERFSFRYRILDAESGIVYYRSALVQANVQVSVLRVELKASGAYILYLNGEPFGKGGAGPGEHQAPLRQGENVLSLESKKGGLKARFSVGGFAFSTDKSWRYSPKAVKNWKDRDFKLDSWRLAKAHNQRFVRSGYFRKTILLNHSEFWPNWKQKHISIAENSVQPLFLRPQGLKGKTLRDYRFYLEVPEPFRVIGATGYYGGRFKPHEFLYGYRGMVERDGTAYRKYVVTTPDAVGYLELIRAYQFCSILVELPESKKPFQEREATFRYYLRAEDDVVQEVPQELRVKTLPPLRGKQPKTYTWQMWMGWWSAADDPDCRKALLRGLAKAGFNDFVIGTELPLGIPGRAMRLINFASWNLDFRPYVEQHPEHALIDNEGKPSQSLVAPIHLINNPEARAFFEKTVAEWLRKHKVKHVNWDYESEVWDSYLACYGEASLKQFRAFAGLAEAVELTPQIIKEKHGPAWIRFMDKQHARLAELMARVVKRADPEALFSVYSGYQSEYTKWHYGVDWSLLAGKIDLAMCGYGRRMKEVNATLKALGGTPLVLGAVAYPYRTTQKNYPDYVTKARFLRRAVDSTGGVLVYKLHTLDGRTFYASAEISRLVADYENLFVLNRRSDSLVTVVGISPDAVAVLTDGKRRLVLIMNEGKKTKKVTITHQNFTDAMQVRDYFAEKDLGPATKLTVEIRPGDAQAFLVEEKIAKTIPRPQ